jgi:hypothetical protein
MSSILASQTLLTFLYMMQVIWRSTAFIYFGLWPEHTMSVGATRKCSDSPIRSTPGGDEWHHDVFRYLGFINSAFALLASPHLFRIRSTGI